MEAQILADAHGNVLFLGERDCTIQRRHQKLVEETPSPAVDATLRARIGEIAVDAARAAGYRSAGTIEGLLTADGSFFFMEMNTRIQVEHTVTELVTGLDLVREQILVAQGEPLSVLQEDVVLRGHAIECRINAEDVEMGFLPAPGLITAYEEPSGPGVRVDSGVRAGEEISELYDPMIAKLIVHDTDRETARRRMLRALAEFRIKGPPTLVGFHAALLTEPCFIAGDTCHGLVESKELAQRAQEMTNLFSHRTTTVSQGADGTHTRERVVSVEVDGRAFDVRLHTTEPPWAALGRRRRERAAAAGTAGSGAVVSPMQGTILKVMVAVGDVVTVGPGRLRRRGDEDGERARRPDRRHCHGAGRRSWAGCDERPAALRRHGRRMSRNEPEVAELLQTLVRNGTLTGAALSRPRRSDPSRPSRVTVAPVAIGGVLRYRFTAHQRTRSTDENLSPEAAVERLAQLLGSEFRQGLFQSTDADWQVLAAGKEARILRRPPSRPTAGLAHDRVKRRLLPEGAPVPFLVELGVMTPAGKVRSQRYDKFRQVNRFLELVEDVLPSLPSGRLRIVDFGSGKSYLTFALHHLLTAVHDREVEIVGLDLKTEVVDHCEALARTLGADGLRFQVGDIAGYEQLDGVDLVVSLHACDTATDDALDRAVRAAAPVILAVPCCQHELLAQLENAALGPLLRHGTLRERFAADVTDAARAQLLGAAGYDVQILEFVELEHTPKNVLLRAVSRPGRDTAKALREYRAFAAELGIDPALGRLLADRLPA